MIAYNQRRKIVNNVMYTLTGVCTALAVGALLFILGYLVWKGGSSLSWSFFTHLPAPVGETGGGMANAIVGSLMMSGLGALMAVPVGILSGIYMSEYAGSRLASAVRFAADTLNGVPSIVIGVFAYTIVVLPFRQFSMIAGAVALGGLVIARHKQRLTWPIVTFWTSVGLAAAFVMAGAVARSSPLWPPLRLPVRSSPRRVGRVRDP
jgi:phosphate transport system permease protein